MPTYHSAAIAALIVPFLTLSAQAAGFTDVERGRSDYQAILYVQEEGIVSGYPDGSYQPDRFINRAEFVKIVVGATFTPPAWNQCDPTNIYSFTDASFTEWYSPYLCVAVQHRIIDGYPNGSFMPTLGINFVEAAKILVTGDRIDQGGNIRYDRTLPKVDGEWYGPYVKYLSDRGAIPIGISRLDQHVTRGDMAEMIYRLRAGITDKPSRSYEELTGAKMLYSPLYELERLPSSTAQNYATNTVYAYSITAPSEQSWEVTEQLFSVDGGRWQYPELHIYSDKARTRLIDTWTSNDNWTESMEAKLKGSLTIPASQTRYFELTVSIGTPADADVISAKHPLLPEVTLPVVYE